MKMKKIAFAVFAVFICGNASAWDIGTYPKEAEMQTVVYHWFVDYAINVDTSETSTESFERISFAMDVISGAINCNTLSVAVATNATIRAKIIASDISYQADLEYVIATAYEPPGVPLFTILANKLYGVRPVRPALAGP